MNIITHILVCFCMFTKYKGLRKTLKYLSTKYIPNHRKRIMLQTKQTFILLMTFGLLIY